MRRMCEQACTVKNLEQGIKVEKVCLKLSLNTFHVPPPPPPFHFPSCGKLTTIPLSYVASPSPLSLKSLSHHPNSSESSHPFSRYSLPVFRTHDIFVWIRIRGSMPLVQLFSSLTFKMPTKKQIWNKNLFFCLLLFEGTFTSFFRDKEVQKKSQNSGNQGFSYYFRLMIEVL